MIDAHMLHGLHILDDSFKRVGIKQGLIVYLAYEDMCRLKQAIPKEIMTMVTLNDLPSQTEMRIGGIKFQYLQRPVT